MTKYSLPLPRTEITAFTKYPRATSWDLLVLHSSQTQVKTLEGMDIFTDRNEL